MKIILTGASGLVGAALVPYLISKGHRVKKLVRHKAPLAHDEAFWDPATGSLDPDEIEGYDAIVNLAGESLSEGRWNEEKKHKIMESRVNSTRLLCQNIEKLDTPPKVLINASAIGFYGDRGGEELSEKSASGTGSFVAKVCREWESTAAAASQKGVRVVFLRIGVVLSAKGGALSKMVPPFKIGLGGVIGSGEQYISWIAIEDLVEAIHYILTHEQIKGPVNAVSPNPVQNKDFVKTLGSVLHRPAIFPLPAFAAKLAFGEMADELLLASARVFPQELQKSGYQFKHPQLNEALTSILT